MLSLVNRVSATGTAVVVLLGLALAAIVEQAVLPDGDSLRSRASHGPSHAAPRRTHPSRSKHRRKPPSPTILLDRQVRRVAMVERGPAVRRVYGTTTVSAPVVRNTRMDHRRTWAFGTEAIPPPSGTTAVPESSPFIAHATGHRWSVALAGTPDFARLMREAPASVVPKAERTALERYNAKPKAADAELALPWSVGQSWTVLPAGDDLSFDGGDGRVLAATAGRLYRVCSPSPDRGLVLVIGSDGTAAAYYQLDRLTQVPDGGLVKQGDYLGRTSTDQPCGGGEAQRRLVRFGLRDSAGPVPLDGVRLGGWTLHLTATKVYAERDGLRVSAGNPLLNFGLTLAPSPAPSKPPRSPKPSHAPKPSHGAHGQA
jgi:hypothetical protein